MDFQNYSQPGQPNQDYDTPPPNSGNIVPDKRSKAFSTASLVMGILSFVCSCCIYAALPFGALAVIFALLSRGGEMRLDSMGKAGLGLGIGGIVVTILMFVCMFIYTANFYGGIDELLQYSNELAEQYMQYYQ